MPFFTFVQNNSGGEFLEPAMYVVVEADDADDANSLAGTVDVYFNGCDAGVDCSCCGDRWSEVWKNDGDPEPMIYGTPVRKHLDQDDWGSTIKRWARESKIPMAIIHYANGSSETIE